MQLKKTNAKGKGKCLIESPKLGLVVFVMTFSNYYVDLVVGASRPLRKTRSLNETYEISTYVDDNFSLLFSTYVRHFNFNESCIDEPRVPTMEDEMLRIQKNDTWQLVDLPHGQFTIGVKWIY